MAQRVLPAEKAQGRIVYWQLWSRKKFSVFEIPSSPTCYPVKTYFKY